LTAASVGVELYDVSLDRARRTAPIHHSIMREHEAKPQKSYRIVSNREARLRRPDEQRRRRAARLRWFKVMAIVAVIAVVELTIYLFWR